MSPANNINRPNLKVNSFSNIFLLIISIAFILVKGRVMIMLKDNIKKLRLENRLSQAQFAKRLHVTQGAVSQWESGRTLPDTSILLSMATEFNVPLDYLNSDPGQRDFESLSEVRRRPVENTLSRHPYETRYFSIPILGDIPAGIPFEAIENVIEYEDLPAARFNPSHQYFGLKVKGDSMEPEYQDGDIIILRRQESCESGDDCAVMVNGDDATFKRVRVGENGITLQPLNYQKYEPKFYTAREVRELPVRIVGIVVEIRRRIKR